MEIVQVPRDVFHTPQIVGHGLQGELAHVFLGRAAVDGVGGVGQNGGQAGLPGQLTVGGNVRRVDGPGRAASGVAGKKLKHVCSDAHGGLAHGRKAAG